MSKKLNFGTSFSNNSYTLEDADAYGGYLWDEDDEDDFGNFCYNSSKKCKYPSDHVFVKKILAIHYYRECSICGYSPELDGAKPDMEKIHEDFINWEKTKKRD